MNNSVEMACFQMITYVGTARSCYINAISCAKSGNFEEAMNLLKEGDVAFAEGHKGHGEMIVQEAKGELSNVGLLMLHAEDQLMSAEGFRIIAEEFIDVYKRLLDK